MSGDNFIDDLKRDIEQFRQDNPDEVDLNDSLDRSLEDIKKGRITPWKEVKRKRLVNYFGVRSGSRNSIGGNP